MQCSALVICPKKLQLCTNSCYMVLQRLVKSRKEEQLYYGPWMGIGFPTKSVPVPYTWNDNAKIIIRFSYTVTQVKTSMWRECDYIMMQSSLISHVRSVSFLCFCYQFQQDGYKNKYM